MNLLEKEFIHFCNIPAEIRFFGCFTEFVKINEVVFLNVGRRPSQPDCSRLTGFGWELALWLFAALPQTAKVLGFAVEIGMWFYVEIFCLLVLFARERDQF